MTKTELIHKLSNAIAEQEGFFVTEAQAKARGIRYPTRAQISANPGNLRVWKDANGRLYPITSGYVDFVAWAAAKFPGASHEEISRRALDEGWLGAGRGGALGTPCRMAVARPSDSLVAPTRAPSVVPPS